MRPRLMPEGVTPVVGTLLIGRGLFWHIQPPEERTLQGELS